MDVPTSVRNRRSIRARRNALWNDTSFFLKTGSRTTMWKIIPPSHATAASRWTAVSAIPSNSMRPPFGTIPGAAAATDGRERPRSRIPIVGPGGDARLDAGQADVRGRTVAADGHGWTRAAHAPGRVDAGRRSTVTYRDADESAPADPPLGGHARRLEPD